MMYRTVAAVAAACLFQGADAQLILQRPNDGGRPSEVMAAPPGHGVMALPAEMDSSQAAVNARMKKRCEWLKKAVASGRAGQMQDNPRFQQIKVMCQKVAYETGEELEEQPLVASPRAQEAAEIQKEAIETKCAWLHKVKETEGTEKLKNKPWFQEVEELCSGVPLAEMEDNAVKIMDQRCVWFEMAKMTGKLGGQQGEKWYKELDEKCAPVAGKSHQQATAMAKKLEGAYGVAQKLFGRVAAGRPVHDEGGYDYAEQDYDDYDHHDNSEIQV